MTNTITITDLTKVAAENNLPANNADTLRAAFLPFFEQASEWREKAFAIKVTNIGQTAEMGRARQARIALKDIRVQTEKTRVAMKEDSLRTGKAIDGMSNVIKFLIEPIEKYLLDQEEYGKRMQEIAQAEARDLRTCEAGKYLPDFPQSIDLGVISDEEFAYTSPKPNSMPAKPPPHRLKTSALSASNAKPPKKRHCGWRMKN
jgi:hypothetical protein